MCCKVLMMLLLFISVLMSQCGLPREFADFGGLTPEQEHQKFKTLSIEKQVDFHIAKMRFHPPVFIFAYDIAEQGDKNLPYLLERLERETDDIRRHSIIVIFKAIHTISIDLREREDVTSRLQNVVDQMREPIWKERSEKSLQYMREPPPKYARPGK